MQGALAAPGPAGAHSDVTLIVLPMATRCTWQPKVGAASTAPPAASPPAPATLPPPPELTPPVPIGLPGACPASPPSPAAFENPLVAPLALSAPPAAAAPPDDDGGT